MTDTGGLPARAWAVHACGAALALLAAVWHAVLMTTATNDNFVHLTLAQQWLAGDWPVRDFFDQGWVLQYSLSAAAQILAGERLLSEALVVGAAWGISTFLVFRVVRRLTGSTAAAALAAILLVVSGARGYSYPKGIVYAAAAALWWGYVERPTTARVVAFGVWTAAAFYWRPDHGVYVAAGLTLAVLAAHGVGRVGLERCLLAGATTIALMAPFLLYVQATVGLLQYAQTGLVAARVEHTTQGPHQWPLFRLSGNLVTIDPADEYAPTAAIRWSTDSAADERAQILARYGLTPLQSDDELVTRVRLAPQSLPQLGSLVNEPIVADTGGIDRSAGRVDSASWPAWQRWRFRYAWLRARLLPTLDAQARASEIAVTLFHLLPLALLAGARRASRHLSAVATPVRLGAFALFALLIDVAMLRSPFSVRAPDAVVLTAIVFGCCVAWMWHQAAASRPSRRLLLGLATVALAAATTASVAGAGRFGERLDGLAGGWTSLPRAQTAWRNVGAELMASPPLRYSVDRPARFSLHLAAYVRECVPPSDRLLVLWFEPEIYYYSSRLMAQRHLVFAPAWSGLAHEQRLTMEKVQRAAPPLALARRSALEDYARATFPALVEYVEREYRQAATVSDGGEAYLIFARGDRPVLRGFGPQDWPCFAAEPSPWSRVGRSGN